MGSRRRLTPLLAAASTRACDPTELCRLLLSAGADPTAADARGHTVLYRAIAARRPHLIELLRDAGAPPRTAPGTEPLLLCLGAHHLNGWWKHNVALRDYPPCPATLRAVLSFYAGQGPPAAELAEEAVRIIDRKLAGDATAPPVAADGSTARSEHTAAMEEANTAAILHHSRRYAASLRPFRRILCEFLYMERLRHHISLIDLQNQAPAEAPPSGGE